MQKKFISIIVLLIVFSLNKSKLLAQMPVCLSSGAGYVYIHSGSSIYNWDPNQPMSATNPALNTINNPYGGLAVGKNIVDVNGPSPTFYALNAGNVAYYNGTAWVTTTHTMPGAALNLCIAGNYLFGLIGASGEVYRYDGTGNSVLATTVPGFNGGGPYDLVGDKDGNFYILRCQAPSWLRKYDFNGALLKEWVVTGVTNSSAGGGFAIVCDKLYVHNTGGLQEGTIGQDTIVVTPFPQPFSGINPADMGSCELGSGGGNSKDTTMTLYRGCFPGKVYFNLFNAQDEDFEYTFKFSGTAVNGVDYDYIDSLLVIPASFVEDSIIINPRLAPSATGTRNGKIEVYANLSCTPGVSGDTATLLQTINIIIKDSIDVAIITPPDTFCPNDLVTITGQLIEPEGLDFYWEPANSIPNPNSLTITTSPISTTKYTLTAFWPGAPSTCPSRSVSYTAVVEPYPTVIVPNDLTVCLQYDSIELRVYVEPEGFKYDLNWQTPDYLSSGNTMTNKFFAPPGEYTKLVTATSPGAGCQGFDSFTITVVPPFQFEEISPVDTTVNYGDEVVLTTRSSAVMWVWEPVDYLNDPVLESPTARPLKDIKYTVIGYDKFGCIDSAYANIKVVHKDNLFIPNAFSPNGDGLNDVFKVYNITFERFMLMQVYNRLGTLVFESQNPDKGWNGDYEGKPAAQDVYFYVIKMVMPDGTPLNYKGDVSLIR